MSTLDQMTRQSFNVGQVVFQNFEGARVPGIAAFEAFVLGQIIHKINDSRIVSRCHEFICAAVE